MDEQLTKKLIGRSAALAVLGVLGRKPSTKDVTQTVSQVQKAEKVEDKDLRKYVFTESEASPAKVQLANGMEVPVLGSRKERRKHMNDVKRAIKKNRPIPVKRKKQ